MLKWISPIVLFCSLLGAFNFAQAGDSCAQRLERIAELRGHFDETDSQSKAELRDAIFTLTVSDSALFTAKPFDDFINEAFDKTKEDVPEKKWKEKELATLKENLKFYKRYIKHGALQPSGKKAYEDKVEVTTKEIEEIYKTRKENRKKRWSLFWGNDPQGFAKLPTEYKVRLASGVWDDLLRFYHLPAKADSLSLEQTKALNQKAKENNLTFKQVVDLGQLTQTLNNDPVLKTLALESIISVMEVVQYDRGLLKSPKKLEKKLFLIVSKNGEVIGKHRAPVSEYRPFVTTLALKDAETVTLTTSSLPGVGLHADGSEDISLKELVTSRYPVLFRERYFILFAKVLKGDSFGFKEFAANLPSYSPVMRRDLSEKIWSALKDHYHVGKIDFSNGDLSREISGFAADDKISADNFVTNSYLLSSIDGQPDIKEKVLTLIEANFADTAAAAPHMENAVKWRKREGGLFAVVPLAAGEVTGLVGGAAGSALLLSHLVSTSNPAAAAIIGAGTLVGSFVGMGTGLIGGEKLMEIPRKYALKKIKAIKDKLTKKHSNQHDENSEE